MNGKLRGGLTIGGVSGISIFGVIAIFNFLTGPIEKDVVEAKNATTKLGEKHDKDFIKIDKKLDKILDFAQEQKTSSEVMKNDIQYMKKDIKEIKAK